MKKLKVVRFFEERNRGSDRVRRISDDHIIARSVVREKFEAVGNDDLDFR